MAGQVFVSYSRTDSAYVTSLLRHLDALHIPVWIDRERINTGDRWAQLLREQVDSSAAVVVVMTPAAEESEWVALEVERARSKGKPILPLLLAGDPFFTLATLHYNDVRGGRMPPPEFGRRLLALATPVVPPVAEPPPVARPAPSPAPPRTPPGTAPQPAAGPLPATSSLIRGAAIKLALIIAAPLLLCFCAVAVVPAVVKKFSGSDQSPVQSVGCRDGSNAPWTVRGTNVTVTIHGFRWNGHELITSVAVENDGATDVGLEVIAHDQDNRELVRGDAYNGSATAHGSVSSELGVTWGSGEPPRTVTLGFKDFFWDAEQRLICRVPIADSARTQAIAGSPTPTVQAAPTTSLPDTSSPPPVVTEVPGPWSVTGSGAKVAISGVSLQNDVVAIPIVVTSDKDLLAFEFKAFDQNDNPIKEAEGSRWESKVQTGHPNRSAVRLHLTTPTTSLRLTFKDLFWSGEQRLTIIVPLPA